MPRTLHLSRFCARVCQVAARTGMSWIRPSQGIQQLELLLEFVQQRVGYGCETSSLSTIPRGQPLTLKTPFVCPRGRWACVVTCVKLISS